MGKKNNNDSGASANKSMPSSTSSTSGESEVVEVIPDEFKKVICDFINDFALTFPEFSEKLDKYSSLDGSVTNVSRRILSDDNIIELYQHCKKVYPVRFFDILYKNVEMFTNRGADEETSSKIDVHFLPGVDFVNVWNTPDITDKTRETIMKYLQLILFSIITNVSDQNSFGDTAKLFEAINEDELKGKLDETFKNMQDLFTGMGMGMGMAGTGGDGDGDGQAGDAGEAGEQMKDFAKLAEQFKNFVPDGIDMSKFPNFNFGDTGTGTDAGTDATGKKPDIPNPEAVHDHISKLLNGKIGALAKEIAEETAGDLDLGIDLENPEQLNMGNVFQKLFKNPGKLMNMVKNVGKKLDDKFKKGDIKESELMQEASDLLNNMKNMPGMGNLSSMLSQLGMKGMGGLGGKGGKVNIGAMQSHLQQNMKNAKMKERMHQKLQQRQEQQQSQQSQQSQQQQERPTTSVYTASSGETIVQTPRVAPQAITTTNQLPIQAINDAEKNLVEWAQAHMTPAPGSGQKKKKKNKK
jgi:hypothetical protein